MFYYIYKTTNIETDEFYIGQHTSKTYFDKKYYGSGLWIKEIKKQKNYKDILRVDVLLYCETKEELMEKENEIILEHIDNDLNKNISDWRQYFGSGENHTQHDKTSYYWVNIKTKDVILSTKYNMKVKYNLNPTGVSNLVSGTVKTSKDWCFVGEVLPERFDIDEHVKAIKISKNIDQSMHVWYNVLSNETVSMIQYDFRKKYKVNASFLVKNNENHCRGWFCIDTSSVEFCENIYQNYLKTRRSTKHYKYNRNVYEWFHETLPENVIYATQYEAKEKLKLSPQEIYMLIKGDRNSAKGWRIKKNGVN